MTTIRANIAEQLRKGYGSLSGNEGVDVPLDKLAAGIAKDRLGGE